VTHCVRHRTVPHAAVRKNWKYFLLLNSAVYCVHSAQLSASVRAAPHASVDADTCVRSADRCVSACIRSVVWYCAVSCVLVRTYDALPGQDFVCGTPGRTLLVAVGPRWVC